jgi:hypothetical protein
MSLILKKLVKLEGPAVEAFAYAKKETGWSDDRLFNTAINLFCIPIGAESHKMNERLFRAMVNYAESQRDLVAMQISASRKEAARPRGKGRPVKIA